MRVPLLKLLMKQQPALTLPVCCLQHTADLCEIESDITPHRSHVARVLQQTMGVYPDTVNLETRYMVRQRLRQALQTVVLRRCSEA
jgi:hypothetical protein